MQPSHAPDQGVGPDGHAALWRLAATPEGLREVLNGIGDIFFSHDEQGKLVFISGAFEAVTGWSAQEALGSDALRLVHPDDHAIAAESLRATMEGKAPGRFELRTLCKSGDYRTLEYRLSPLRSGGRVVGTIGVARDMTEQKQAEAALRQSEDHFRRITEWVTDYIFTVHVENGAPVRTVHGAACEAVTGYTAAEFASDPYLWIRMVPEEDCPTVLRQAASILAGGKVEAIEHRIVRKDGVVRWVRNTPALHYDAQGRLVSYDGLVRDVTELKRIEEQLRQTAKMEALGQLAGGIAHDFNNLLTAILGFANILKNSVPAGGEAHEAACTIERAAERASDMTSRLLGFARKGKTQIAPVDLEATVEETARLLSRTLDKNIHITCRFGPERLWTLGDPTQMQQVFLNLAVNARDAMPKGGDLLIRAERMEIAAEAPQRRAGAAPGSYAVVSMSDSGCGIPPENLERIFEPFFTTKPMGRGMGLATTRSIVRDHHGQIRAGSVPGNGTMVTVWLPTVPDSAQKPVTRRKSRKKT